MLSAYFDFRCHFRFYNREHQRKAVRERKLQNWTEKGLRFTPDLELYAYLAP